MLRYQLDARFIFRIRNRVFIERLNALRLMNRDFALMIEEASYLPRIIKASFTQSERVLTCDGLRWWKTRVSFVTRLGETIKLCCTVCGAALVKAVRKLHGASAWGGRLKELGS